MGLSLPSGLVCRIERVAFGMPSRHCTQPSPARPRTTQPSNAAHQPVLPRHQRCVHAPPQASSICARQPPLRVSQPAQADRHGGAAGGQRCAARLQVLALQLRLEPQLLYLLLQLFCLPGQQVW